MVSTLLEVAVDVPHVIDLHMGELVRLQVPGTVPGTMPGIWVEGQVGRATNISAERARVLDWPPAIVCALER